MVEWFMVLDVFFFQAEDGIRYLVRSRGLGDVYKRQLRVEFALRFHPIEQFLQPPHQQQLQISAFDLHLACLLYTSDAADERSSVDLGGRRIIKKKKNDNSAKVTHRR